MKERAMIILSGGQDSTTCLYWAMKRFHTENIEAVTFDYGQRHKVEITCAKRIAEQHSIPHHIIPINSFEMLGQNSLTDKKVKFDAGSHRELPRTFVPGRNLIFLTFAASLAWQKKINHLVIGTAQTDYSGYPDCRESTITAMERTLNLGLDYFFKVHAPLMHLTKKETVFLAMELDAIDAMALTHTCYRGEQPPCMDCEACKLRAKGFKEAGIIDPLVN